MAEIDPPDEERLLEDASTFRVARYAMKKSYVFMNDAMFLSGRFHPGNPLGTVLRKELLKLEEDLRQALDRVQRAMEKYEDQG